MLHCLHVSCHPLSSARMQEWPALLTTYAFATEGVGLSVVALVGVAANCISVAILCQG